MPNSTQEQAERHVALRQLLHHGPAKTQRAIVAALKAAGHTATQSSVSRDLRELGAIKTSSGYELPGDEESDAEQMSGIAGLLRAINPAGPNLLVIRTAIGAAQRVALALDRCAWPEMIGNIGGDDTVFVATDSAQHQKNLLARIERSTRVQPSV
jgi:transcriptional regulator of arginine metabolism